MAPSFVYPPNLLHKTTEPQWFPRPMDEDESALDALEAAEEDHFEFLRSIAQKEAPDPIGVGVTPTPPGATAATASSASYTHHHPGAYGAPPPTAAAAAPPPPPVDPPLAAAEVASYPIYAPTSTRPRFWNQSRPSASSSATASAGAGAVSL